MKVICQSGFLKFYPKNSSEVSDFNTYFSKSLIRNGDHWTFPALAALPDYSIKGRPFADLVAIETIEGEPWQVMQANGLVYDLTLDAIVPKQTIISEVQLPQTGSYYTADVPLVQPGAFVAFGVQVMSYHAELFLGINELRVLSFGYE